MQESKNNTQGNTDEILLISYDLHERGLIRIRELSKILCGFFSNVVKCCCRDSVSSGNCTDTPLCSCTFLPKSQQNGKEGVSAFLSRFWLHLPLGSVLQDTKNWNHRYQMSIYLGAQHHLESMEDLSWLFSWILSTWFYTVFISQSAHSQQHTFGPPVEDDGWIGNLD